MLKVVDRRSISATRSEVINDFLGPIYLFADCPLSPIHDGVVHIVRLNVCIHAENFDAMLHPSFAAEKSHSFSCLRLNGVFGQWSFT